MSIQDICVLFLSIFDAFVFEAGGSLVVDMVGPRGMVGTPWVVKVGLFRLSVGVPRPELWPNRSSVCSSTLPSFSSKSCLRLLWSSRSRI